MRAEFIRVATKSIFNSSYNGKLPEEYIRAYQDILTETHQYGQLRPIIVRQVSEYQYAVIAGHFTMNAIKECGFEMAFCINLGTMSNAEAAKRSLELAHEFMCCDLFEIGLAMAEMENEAGVQGMPMPYSEKSIDAVHNAIKANISGQNVNQVTMFS